MILITLFQGYTFLTELTLQLEEESQTSPAALESLNNIVVLVTSLTTCGHNTLKPNPQNMSTPFTLPNLHQQNQPQEPDQFYPADKASPSSSLPTTTGGNSSIRNIHAFNVLVTLFNKSTTNTLSNAILDSMNTYDCFFEFLHSVCLVPDGQYQKI